MSTNTGFHNLIFVTSVAVAASLALSCSSTDTDGRAQELTAEECASYETEEACFDAGCGEAGWVGIGWKGTVTDGMCEAKPASGNHCFLQEDDIGYANVATAYSRVLEDGTKEVWGVSADIGPVSGWTKCPLGGPNRNCGCGDVP